MTHDDSHIDVDANGRPLCFHGPDATAYFRARTVMASIILYQKTGLQPTRGVGITRLLAIASEYTGKRYRRGQADAAVADLKIWTETMLAALPIVTR